MRLTRLVKGILVKSRVKSTLVILLLKITKTLSNVRSGMAGNMHLNSVQPMEKPVPNVESQIISRHTANPKQLQMSKATEGGEELYLNTLQIVNSLDRGLIGNGGKRSLNQTVLVEGIPIEMKLDCGAEVSTISEYLYNRYFGHNFKLRSTNVVLKC